MIVSQRDPRWGNIKLGFGDTLIKDYGCTITSYGYLVGKYPNVVNDEIKLANGFTGDNKNLVVWTKIPGFEWRGWIYENDRVLDAISKYGACLVEVDAKAIGGSGKHWVVFTGNRVAQDPWTGTERPTSDFTPTGYAIIRADKAQIGKYMADMVQVEPSKFEELVTKATAYDELVKVGIKQPQDVTNLKNIIQEEKTLREKAQTEAQGARDELTIFKSSVAEKLGSTQDLPRILGAIDEIVGTIDSMTSRLRVADEKIGEFERQVTELKAEIKRLELLLEANNSLSTASMYDMILELLARITKILRRN